MTRFLITYHDLPYPDLDAVAVDRRALRGLLENHPFIALGATIQINECLEV